MNKKIKKNFDLFILNSPRKPKKREKETEIDKSGAKWKRKQNKANLAEAEKDYDHNVWLEKK